MILVGWMEIWLTPGKLKKKTLANKKGVPPTTTQSI
jgi:hypothetical protein